MIFGKNRLTFCTALAVLVMVPSGKSYSEPTNNDFVYLVNFLSKNYSGYGKLDDNGPDEKIGLVHFNSLPTEEQLAVLQDYTEKYDDPHLKVVLRNNINVSTKQDPDSSSLQLPENLLSWSQSNGKLTIAFVRGDDKDLLVKLDGSKKKWIKVLGEKEHNSDTVKLHEKDAFVFGKNTAEIEYFCDNSILKIGFRYFIENGATINSDTCNFDNVVPSGKHSIRRFNDQTLVLRTPHFGSWAKNDVEKLLAQHHSEIINSELLIIDMRESWGGADFTYRKLMEYIQTRPTYKVGVETLSSKDNIANYSKFLTDERFPESEKASLAKLIESLENNLGEFVRKGRGVSIRMPNKSHENPKNVAIIITNAKSTGEQFILEASQSYKVRLFGQPTSGVLDYSNVLYQLFPSGKFELEYPTSRSLRLPEYSIDNVGIKPDYYIPKEVSDPIDYIVNWYQKENR